MMDVRHLLRPLQGHPHPQGAPDEHSARDAHHRHPHVSRVDPLDVAGPYEVFSSMADAGGGPCAVTVHVLGETLDQVPTRFGIALVPTATFAERPRAGRAVGARRRLSALQTMMQGGPYLERSTPGPPARAS